MNENAPFILKLIDPSIIRYEYVLAFLGLYFAGMWLMFCIWVFIDANRRFKKLWIAILFTLIVLPFNIPGFILYLIARPEEDLYYSADEMLPANAGPTSAGGVNVPVVNFKDEKGEVVLSFNLHINRHANPTSDMVIKVDWDSQQPHFHVTGNAEEAMHVDRNEVVPTHTGISSKFEEARQKAFGSLRSVKDSITRSVKSSLPEGEEKNDDKSDKKAKK